MTEAERAPDPPVRAEPDGVRVNDQVVIPRAELTARASRAGGAGGQHVNTSATRIELLWNPATSLALSDEQRARVHARLASRIDALGNVRVVASARRSQRQNRDLAEQRLAELVAGALAVAKRRRPTRPGRAAREARLDAKRRASEKKQRRRWQDD